MKEGIVVVVFFKGFIGFFVATSSIDFCQRKIPKAF